MEKLRVAMVGAGGRGMSHIRSIAGAPNIEFVAICDLIEEVGQPVAEEFGVDYVPNIETLLADYEIKAVGLCVQTPHHYETAMPVIEAGKHLLTEKPMASSIAQAREMMEEVERRGLVAAISYQLRFGPVFRKMKEICERIDPLQVLFARQRGMLKDKYLSPAPFDGIMDFISHDIDMVPFLAGREPKAVFATMGRDVWAEAGAIAYMGAQIELGEGSHKTVGVISSSMGGAGVPQRLDVVGRDGLAVATGSEIKYAIGPNPGQDGVPRDVWNATFAGEGRDFTADLYRHWADACLHPDVDLAPAASYRDGYNALLLSLAMVESGESGEVIDLAEFAEASA
ncbi:MAG: Gfo/Idh/MocA family oxidoreductase [Armatimonadota bacterium]|nr:Gfo/Idh/MocA family oxidoreductase [Armatimonadota bacterium]